MGFPAGHFYSSVLSGGRSKEGEVLTFFKFTSPVPSSCFINGETGLELRVSSQFSQ